jgi:hypothetical protein
MSNQPRSSAIATKFDRDEWELLVTLPRRVLLAAAAAEPADARDTAAGIAGIEAIASGLASTSTLVRDVVGSIYSESHHEPQELLGDGDMLQTLAACRYASEVLANRAGGIDAEAYRAWLCHIAAVVTGVAQGVGGRVATGRVALLESRFLYALDGVLRP